MSKSSIKARLFFSRFTKHRLETGFSMLEAVVVVGVLLALAVGGFIAYGQITENAKTAKVKSSASEVHTAVISASIDGDPNTKPEDVVKDWNSSTDKIKVEILPPTAGGASSNGDFCIQATNQESTDIISREGDCSDVTSAPVGGGSDITAPAGSSLRPGVLAYFNSSQKSLESADFGVMVRGKGVGIGADSDAIVRFLDASDADWMKLEANSDDFDQYNALADSTDPTLAALSDAVNAEWGKISSGDTSQQKIVDANRAWMQAMANATV